MYAKMLMIIINLLIIFTNWNKYIYVIIRSVIYPEQNIEHIEQLVSKDICMQNAP